MKLAVVGSINIDMTVTTERIPRKGETLQGTDLRWSPGGKGANQAVAMAKLGATVGMFGCVGNDANGKKMLANLQGFGIATEQIAVLEDVPTGIAMITVGENDNTIVVVAGANSKVDRAYVNQVKPILATYDMLVLQHEIPLDTVHDLVHFCAERDIPVLLNPAPAAPVPPAILDQVSYLTPNEHEATLLFGKERTMETVLRQYPEKLIITQGSNGVSTCLRSGEILHMAARPAKVVDTTGAGDTFHGAFAVQIAAGRNIQAALAYANTAASLSTEKFGAQAGMPTAQEVEAAQRNP